MGVIVGLMMAILSMGAFLYLSDQLSDPNHVKAVNMAWHTGLTQEERQFISDQMDKEKREDEARWCRKSAERYLLGLEPGEPSFFHPAPPEECGGEKLRTAINAVLRERNQ